MLSITSKESGDAPFATGWIRAESTDNTTKASWQDYVEINHFITANNLSVNTGNHLLNLIKDLCKRRGIEINLPRTMRSIR